MDNIEYITFHIMIPFKKFKAYTEENLYFNIPICSESKFLLVKILAEALAAQWLSIDL